MAHCAASEASHGSGAFKSSSCTEEQVKRAVHAVFSLRGPRRSNGDLLIAKWDCLLQSRSHDLDMQRAQAQPRCHGFGEETARHEGTGKGRLRPARLVFPEGEGHAAGEAHGADLVHGAGDGHVLVVVPAAPRQARDMCVVRPGVWRACVCCACSAQQVLQQAAMESSARPSDRSSRRFAIAEASRGGLAKRSHVRP